jgi:hypothetical protein
MFQLHSVTGRIAIGKGIGLIVGIVSMTFLPSFGFSVFSMFGFGTLLVFVLMGAMIGFMGQFDRHPVLDFKMTWWMRGAVVGFVFMLMYILLSYASLETIMQSNIVSWMGLSSPFWALIDGVIIGALMGFIETKVAGDGPMLPLK